MSLVESLRFGWLAARVALVATLAVVLLGVPALAAAMIALDPGEGASGTSFLVSGNGFGAAEKVQIRWDGSPLGGPVPTNSSGEFSITFTVPVVALPGAHTVTARGLQSNLTAQAVFTVSAPPVTTTTGPPVTTTTGPPVTTTTGPPVTTTTLPPVTTTTGPPVTTTTGPGGVTTTTTAEDDTTTTIAEQEAVIAVIEFSVTPSSAPPGAEIEVEAKLAGEADQLELWLDDRRLGPPIGVSADRSLRVTRMIPDVEPGTHWLRLKTTDGRVLVTRVFDVITDEELETGVTDVGGVFDFGAVLTNPVGFITVVVMALLAGISVWFMWKPSRDEKRAKEADQQNRDRKLWRRARGSAPDGAPDEDDPGTAGTEEEPKEPPAEDSNGLEPTL